MILATPSPLVSPAATRTPPVKRAGVGKEVWRVRALSRPLNASHVRSAAGVGTDDDIRHPVAVQVADGDVATAREVGSKAKKCRTIWPVRPS